jgi:hypothetical protein
MKVEAMFDNTESAQCIFLRGVCHVHGSPFRHRKHNEHKNGQHEPRYAIMRPLIDGTRSPSRLCGPAQSSPPRGFLFSLCFERP